MKLIARYFALVALVLIVPPTMRAQEFVFPHPPYPGGGLRGHLQGAGVVSVTFAGYNQPPVKVEMVKSMGSPVLDFSITDWAKRYWVIVYFTDAERKNPVAMNAKLKQFMPSDLTRKMTIEALAHAPSKQIVFPVTKLVPVSWRYKRR